MGEKGAQWLVTLARQGCTSATSVPLFSHPERYLVAIFCEKRSETVAKHMINQSKITLFRPAIPKMAVFAGKIEILVFFGGLGPFRPPNPAKLFLGQPHDSALRGKKFRSYFFFRPKMGPHLRRTTFY